jgi:prepilin-type processing-associated H-X9-DG protein
MSTEEGPKMRKKLLVAVFAVAIVCFAASAVTAVPLPSDLSGYFKFGYTDGNTYAVRVEMGVGAVNAYILPYDNEHYLGVIVGDKIYFQDRRDDEGWGVLTAIDADTFLITGYDANEGVTNEFTVIRITEEEANEIAERTEADDDRSTCVNNLKQLGLMLNMFANEHDSEFPYSLSELSPEYATYSGVFVCPARGDTFIDYDYDYEYIPGYRIGDPNPDLEPIIIERTGNHTAPAGKMHHVLYLDGHVEIHKDQ